MNWLRRLLGLLPVYTMLDEAEEDRRRRRSWVDTAFGRPVTHEERERIDRCLERFREEARRGER